ncbi:flagellin lysine-N-methylase [Selenomonas sp.]|uniref:flagellin lysine-N-methylase n=1 Tax=Selenomonas sp. TaxID=2053611 RepID=UPI0025F2D79E|nr:flagellin lysine-N-methylase [Selenomonas sp.]
MITFYPDFYEKFTCKAAACQHSCCKGWEIDIDAQTAARYQQLPDALGAEIRQNIVRCDGLWQFRLNQDGCCPFLQADGLCRLIRKAGESILCDICANHPRFFVTAGAFELAGVGLSCEKSCELLLADLSTLTFHGEDSDRSIDLSTLLLQMGMELPAEELVYMAGMTPEDAKFVLDCMKKTAPIDDAWTKQLEELSAITDKLMPPTERELALLTRIYQYLVYRALEHLETYGMAAILSYGQLNADFISLLYQLTGQLDESVRRWSEQIEYSVENVRCLMELV